MFTHKHNYVNHNLSLFTAVYDDKLMSKTVSSRLPTRVLVVVIDLNISPGEKMQREVDSSSEHKENGDQIDRSAVEVTNTQIVS